MSEAAPNLIPCACCGAEGVVHEEVDLGPVCPECRGQLRAAGAWLKHAGLRVCSHHAEWRERRRLIGDHGEEAA